MRCVRHGSLSPDSREFIGRKAESSEGERVENIPDSRSERQRTAPYSSSPTLSIQSVPPSEFAAGFMAM